MLASLTCSITWNPTTTPEQTQPASSLVQGWSARQLLLRCYYGVTAATSTHTQVADKTWSYAATMG